MKRTTITLIFLIALSILRSYSQTKNDTLIFGLKNSILYKEKQFKDFNHTEKYYPKNIKAIIKPELRIRLESQLGISIRAKQNNTNFYNSSLCNFDSYLTGEENADLIGDFFLQIGEHDFNNDGVAEIIIVYGVKGRYLDCKIFQYYEPANISDADREENWAQISDFEEFGTYNIANFAYVKDNRFFFPYGLRGLSTNYIYVDRRFIEY